MDQHHGWQPEKNEANVLRSPMVTLLEHNKKTNVTLATTSVTQSIEIPGSANAIMLILLLKHISIR